MTIGENDLTGVIPTELADMTKLEILNICECYSSYLNILISCIETIFYIYGLTPNKP